MERRRPPDPAEPRESDGSAGPAEDASVLGAVVGAEARRILTEEQLRGDPRRLADGWKRRFITDVGRAEELMELYRALGYEVCADPVLPDAIAEECHDCALLARSAFVMVYTRRCEAES